MTDDRTDSTHLDNEPEFNLPTPRFDERATANAQPVQPIAADPVSAFYNRVVSIGRAVTSRSRALVLVVIAGLATGTLGGMAWVKERQVTAVSPSAPESVSELVSADSRNEAPRAEVLGVTDLQSAGPATGIRRSRARARSNRATRAYRVAVLR